VAVAVSTRSAGTATSTMRPTTSSFLAPGKADTGQLAVLWPPSAQSGVSAAHLIASLGTVDVDDHLIGAL